MNTMYSVKCSNMLQSWLWDASDKGATRSEDSFFSKYVESKETNGKKADAYDVANTQKGRQNSRKANK